MVTASLRRQCVQFLLKMRLSVCRACALVGMSRSSLGYKARREENPKLIERIKKIADKYKRFGYRRTWAMLRREGMVINHKKVQRIRKDLRLSLQRKAVRKPRPGTAQLPCQAAFENHVWTYDFMFDVLVDGRKLKFLSVVAEETVKHHVDNILSKLGVDNRTSAATPALLRGIVHPTDL